MTDVDLNAYKTRTFSISGAETDPARLLDLTRRCMVEAALSGVVKNIAFDLSSKNILVNNILPGVIDNEMSQKILLPEQFEYIKTYMNFGRLISLDDVYKTIKFFTIDNTGITGQSIKVDLGFTNFRKYN